MSNIRVLYHSLAKSKLRMPIIWYRHQKIRPNDVMLASYPRSGNTWLRFLLFELLTGIPADFITINRSDSAVPELRNLGSMPGALAGNGRIIKTHEPFRREYQKAIYLVRDPKDVAISEYHYLQNRNIEYKSFDHFLDEFLKGKVNGFGNWPQHVQAWLTAKKENKAQILVIKYEEMRLATELTLNKILGFLNLQLDPRFIQAAIQNNDISKMREKEEDTNESIFKHHRHGINFIGQGIVKGWEKKLTKQQIRTLEDATQDFLDLLEYK